MRPSRQSATEHAAPAASKASKQQLRQLEDLAGIVEIEAGGARV